MSLFLKKDGSARSAGNIAATIVMLPVTAIALIMLLIGNRGRISEEDLDSFADFGTNLLVFGVVITGVMMLVFALIGLTVIFLAG